MKYINTSTHQYIGLYKAGGGSVRAQIWKWLKMAENGWISCVFFCKATIRKQVYDCLFLKMYNNLYNLIMYIWMLCYRCCVVNIVFKKIIKDGITKGAFSSVQQLAIPVIQ